MRGLHRAPQPEPPPFTWPLFLVLMLCGMLAGALFMYSLLDYRGVM